MSNSIEILPNPPFLAGQILGFYFPKTRLVPHVFNRDLCLVEMPGTLKVPGILAFSILINLPIH